jgi:uncharacterized membrane protein YkoI
VRNGRAAALRDILQEVHKSFPGDVVRVRLRGPADNLTYHIRVLSSSGTVIDLRVDAVSGKITRVSS